jgi:predicted membrane protein
VAISRWGLYTREIFWWSSGLTVVALVAFGVGLRVQDRVPQATFSRILHLLLFAMGIFFVYRGL